jgi:hypothetical protein
VRLAERGAVFAGKRQVRHIHHRCNAARILNLELAAERWVGVAAAIVDAVSRGPEGAGISVELIAVPFAIDRRAAADSPSDLMPVAGPVDGELLDDRANELEYPLQRRATPLVHIP